jgi:hypothetical protein
LRAVLLHTWLAATMRHSLVGLPSRFGPVFLLILVGFLTTVLLRYVVVGNETVLHAILGLAIGEWLALFLFGIPAASAYGLAGMAINITSLPFAGGHNSTFLSMFDIWNMAVFLAIGYQAFKTKK